MSNLTTEQLDVLTYSSLIASILSFAGGSIMLGSYFLTKKKLPFSTKLIMTLTGFDLIYSFSNLLTLMDDISSICVIEAVVRTFGFVGAPYWIARLQAVIYGQIASPSLGISLKYNLWLKESVAIAIYPSVAVVVSLVSGWGSLNFGKVENYCTITPPIESNWLGFVVPFLLFLAIFYAFRSYLKLKEFGIKGGSAVTTLWIYPLVGIISYFPAVIDFFLLLFNDQSPFYLQLAHYIFVRISGFVNVMIFGFRRIRNMNDPNALGQETPSRKHSDISAAVVEEEKRSASELRIALGNNY